MYKTGIFFPLVLFISTTTLAKSTQATVDSFSKPAAVSIDKAGGINVTTFDDKYSAKITGFFQVYPALFYGDATNQTFWQW